MNKAARRRNARPPIAGNRTRLSLPILFAVWSVLLSIGPASRAADDNPPRKLPYPDVPASPGGGWPGVDIRTTEEQRDTGPVVNVSVRSGNQSETAIAINPTNPDNIVVFSNEASVSAIFRAYSFDGGATWTRGDILPGSCCDGQAVFDSFGNLFLVCLGPSGGVDLVLSIDGGATFTPPLTLSTGSADQPSIAVGNGSVWVDWNANGSMVARGARVLGLGLVGLFNARQTIPGANGSFGGITVGPGPNGGKVMVAYESPYGNEGPASIYVNVDEDGLGIGGFGSRVLATTTNVGGFDYIPAQSRRSVDAEAGLVWDATGGPYHDRVYLVYTEETVNENNDTDIMVRTSTDDGQTWSDPVRVNDDPSSPIRSQFNPFLSLDRTSGAVAIGWHDARNDNGVPGPGGTNNTANDDTEYFASFSVDGGATWAPNERMSGGFSNAARSGNGIDYGDYTGTAAHGGIFRPAWADNSNSTGDNPDGTLGRFDIYSASMTLGVPAAVGEPPSGGPSPLSGVSSLLALAAPSPNPTAGGIEVRYSLPTPGRVRLTLHDVSGRELATLREGTEGAGWHSLAWDGRIGGGSLPAGVFFVRATVDGQSQVQRMVVLR